MATVKKKSNPLKKTASTTSKAELEFNRVIIQLFGNYHLKDINDYLWTWLQVALAKEGSPYDEAKERSNLLFFYENLLELFQALVLINARLQEKNAD